LAVLGSTNGEPGLATGSSYDAAVTLSQAYQAGSLGLHRVGLYGYFGRATVEQTTGGEAIPGAMTNTKPFYRMGFTGSFFFRDLELLPFFMHASDDEYLATATPGDQPLPTGAQSAVWNSGMLEAHYIVNPQLALIGRAEAIRMSKQPLTSFPDDFGNINALTFGIRSYAFMFSRDGLALHAEYSFVRNIGTMPLSGDGAGVPPLSPSTRVRSSSLLLGLDFAF
jgi:hypothetical protein